MNIIGNSTMYHASVMDPLCRRPSRGARGFTLLEVMIALVVLSIGLLGMAALQARAMRYNHDALVRSESTALANDIMDRMRSRALTLSGGAAETALGAYVGAAPAGACATTPVTAAVDLRCWLDGIQRVLPGGAASATGAITLQAGGANGDPTDDVYQVAISWIDRQTNALTTQFFTFQP